MNSRTNYGLGGRKRIPMKRSIIALLGLLGLMMTLFTAAPAQADGTYTAIACQTYSQRFITSCVRVNWSRQADGTGSRLEQFQVTTPDGCNELEDAGGRYNPVTGVAETAQGSIDYTYNFGAEDCTFTKDLSNAIGDTGCGRITWGLEARIDNDFDRVAYFAWDICPNGVRDLVLLANGPA